MQAVNQMQQYIGRTQQAVIACNNLVAAQARAAAAQASAKSSSSSSKSSSSSGGGSSYSGGNRYKLENQFGGNLGIWDNKTGNWVKVAGPSNTDAGKKLQEEFYKNYNGVKMSTGGYTGEWSNGNKETDNGKLAWLHQKELVLNETDTKNILDAVKSIRDLNVSSIDDAIMSGIANMIVKLSTNSIGNIPNSTSTNTSSNIFHITAEFPNANDVNEIREAIMSLPNLASQYLARR